MTLVYIPHGHNSMLLMKVGLYGIVLGIYSGYQPRGTRH